MMNGSTPAAQLSMDLDSIIAANRTGRNSSNGRGGRGGRRGGSHSMNSRNDRDRPSRGRSAGILTRNLNSGGSATSAKTKISVTNLERGVTEADLKVCIHGCSCSVWSVFQCSLKKSIPLSIYTGFPIRNRPFFRN
jgi:hypothetical protein